MPSRIIDHPELKNLKNYGTRTQTTGIVIHHPALYEGSVQRIHDAELSRLGGFPYNYYVRKNGSIHRIRNHYAIAAHCTGQNTTTIGVCYEGYYHPNPNGKFDKVMPAVQFNAGVWLLRYLISLHPNIPSQKGIEGHRKYKATACPGDYFPMAGTLAAVFAVEKPVESPAESAQYVAVTSQTLTFRDAPNVGAAIVGSLKHGDTLQLLQAMQPWAKVRRADGMEGYVGWAYIQPTTAPAPAYTKDKPLIIRTQAAKEYPQIKYTLYPLPHTRVGIGTAKGVTDAAASRTARENITQYAKRTGHDFVGNGTFFGEKSSTPIIVDGKQMFTTPGESHWMRGLTIDQAGSPGFGDLIPGITHQAMAGRPMLIIDGQPVPAAQRVVDNHFEHLDLVRQAYAWTPGDVWASITAEWPGVDIDTLIEWAVTMGFMYVIGVDGGGSAFQIAFINGEVVYLTACTDKGRPLANFVHWDVDVPYVVIHQIKKGAKNDTVAYLQRLLIALRYDLGTAGADGDFGTKTDAAVRAYQKARGLVADGIVGNKTWDALGV